MQQIEPHFFAIIRASETACDLLDVLPDNDLVMELRQLMNTQWDLICHVISHKHYGSHGIEDFIDYADELRLQVLRIKGEW